MKEPKEATSWSGIVSLQSKRWCCIQDQGNGRHWFYEPSISYTRKESISQLIRGGSITWSELRKMHHWRCSKITISILEL